MGNSQHAKLRTFEKRTGFLLSKPASSLKIGDVIVVSKTGEFDYAGFNVPSVHLPRNIEAALTSTKMREGCVLVFENKTQQLSEWQSELEQAVPGLRVQEIPSKNFMSEGAFALNLNMGGESKGDNGGKLQAAFGFKKDHTLAIRVENAVYVHFLERTLDLREIKRALTDSVRENDLYDKELAIVIGEVWGAQYSYHGGAKSTWNATVGAAATVQRLALSMSASLGIENFTETSSAVVESKNSCAVYHTIQFKIPRPRAARPIAPAENGSQGSFFARDRDAAQGREGSNASIEEKVVPKGESATTEEVGESEQEPELVLSDPVFPLYPKEGDVLNPVPPEGK